MNMTVWPKVSIVFFSYNDSQGVKKALDSVKKQIYPKNKLELIVIDNNSHDDSATVAKKYTSKVWIDKTRKLFSMRANGMRRASGEFVYMILEQDMEFRSRYFLQRMVKPLLVNSELAASFTREYPRKDQPWVTRFISYHPVQCDPLFEYLSVPIKDTVIKKDKLYELCRYELGNIPPVTHMLFRRSCLEKSHVWNQKQDFDHDTVTKLVKAGYQYFAYVPNAGDYHNHAINLKQLLSKRIRNLNNHYFPCHGKSSFTWSDNSRLFVLKMFVWILYVHLIIPATIKGLVKFIRYKDWVLLLEPMFALVITDVVLWTFLTNRVGRKLISGFVLTLINGGVDSRTMVRSTASHNK